jgi:hypothetical protein
MPPKTGYGCLDALMAPRRVGRSPNEEALACCACPRLAGLDEKLIIADNGHRVQPYSPPNGVITMA